MTVPELEILLPKFYQHLPPQAQHWKLVRTQAARHMRRVGVNPLFDIQRPNESEEIRDYRDSIRRDLTTEGPWKFISKLSRVFIENGLSVDETSVSDTMSAWLELGVYIRGEARIKLMPFIFDLLFPMCIEDPNGFLAVLPFNVSAPEVPPAFEPEAGGLPLNEAVDPRFVFVSSADIRYLDRDILCWQGGTMVYDAKEKRSAPFYWVVDKEAYYRKIPVKAKSGYEYELELWYVHRGGVVPAVSLCGQATRYESEPRVPAQDIFYNESFLRPYFEYADEAVTSFSDNQAVRTQHAYPKMVVGPTVCQAEGCRGGKIRIRDPETGDVIDIRECGTCDGTGYIGNPGPYNFLIRREVPGQQTPLPPLDFIVPPDAMVKHSYEVPFDLILRAKRAIGLDLLENLSESGRAKSLRLEGMKDFILSIGEKLFEIVRNSLLIAEVLLNVNPANRATPRVRIPPAIQFSDIDTLKKEAEEALPGDRYESVMSYYRKKYRQDPVTIRVHELALKWAPLLLQTEESRRTGLMIGAYDVNDVLKKDLAYIIFEKISNMDVEEFSSNLTNSADADQIFLSLPEEALFEMADILFEPYRKDMQLQEPSFPEDELDEPPGEPIADA